MKRKTSYLFTCLAITLFISAKAQDPAPGSVTVFSSDGENFTLYLNGEQKNASPASRVVVPTVTEAAVAFRIVFQGSVPELKKNGYRQGVNCLYSIEKNKKGERVLRMRECTDEATPTQNDAVQPSSEPAATAVAGPAPAQLAAKYADGVITINDGRTLTVKKVKANGMTYPQVIMTALTGARVTITYDDNAEKYSAESPFKYEVKDFANNNSYLTLTVDEGGAEKTWKVKLQNTNGYDLKIE